MKEFLRVCKTLLGMLSPKAWVILLCVAFGIPTSIYGAQWMAFKFAKQEADCYSDMAFDLTNMKPAAAEGRLEQMSKSLDGYRICLDGVTPNKGSIAFLREQSQRQKAGRP